MTSWKELGDGEYTRILDDGSVAKVREQLPFWRAAVDGRVVDDIFFDARTAMQAIDAWDAWGGEISFHPIERYWFGDDRRGFSRNSQKGELKVAQVPCGSWKINQVPERCFSHAANAQRYADERLP